MPPKFIFDDDDDVAALLNTQGPPSANCPTSPLPPADRPIEAVKRARDNTSNPSDEVAASSETASIATRGGDGMAKMSLLAFGMAKRSLVNTGGLSQHTPKAQKLPRTESPKLPVVGKPLTFSSPPAVTVRAATAAPPSPASSPPGAATAVSSLPSPAVSAEKAAAAVRPQLDASPAAAGPKKTQTSLLSFFSKMAHKPTTPPT